MSKILGGVQIAGYICPTDSADTYAVTDETYNRGSYRSVQDATARISIPQDRRSVGMIVYQTTDDTYWQLKNDIADTNWELWKIGSGGSNAPQTEKITFTLPAANGQFLTQNGLPWGTGAFVFNEACTGVGFFFSSTTKINRDILLLKNNIIIETLSIGDVFSYTAQLNDAFNVGDTFKIFVSNSNLKLTNVQSQLKVVL